MNDMMMTGVVIIHLALAMCLGVLLGSLTWGAGGVLLWLVMFIAGVLLYVTLVGAFAWLLTYVLGLINEEDDNEQLD
jgi:hypothetical protein